MTDFTAEDLAIIAEIVHAPEPHDDRYCSGCGCRNDAVGCINRGCGEFHRNLDEHSIFYTGGIQ